jgi:preprotein translocase subunit SecB
MKPSPISLIDYFATDLVLATNRAFSDNKKVEFIDAEFVVDVAVKRSDGSAETDHRWQVVLEVRHQPSPATNFPYSYRVVLVGQFSVAASVMADEEERTVRIHGASVLYGMTREIVRVLTGRGPYRPVLIPTVSFYDQKAPAAVSVAPAPSAVPQGPDQKPRRTRKSTK